MRLLHIVSIASIFLSITQAFAADNPSYQEGILSIPSVDTADQVGQYQDASFKLLPDGNWQLLNFSELGNSKLRIAPVDKVEVITIPSSPVQVLLKVSGAFNNGCGNLGATRQRFADNKFDVLINAIYPFPLNLLCTQNIRPFIKTISLPVYGLVAGTYHYQVNGVTGSFSLTSDNNLPGDCDGSNLIPCQ